MPHRLRVLLIAPSETNLNIRPEVLTIQRSFRTQRAITFADVYEITRDQQFDIIHIASHGDDKGIHLDNESLGMDILARIARKTRAKLVYFNSCNSARLGQYLLDQGVPAIIMTSTEIDDKQDAWSIAGYFYSELLTNGGNFKLAFKIAKPDDGTLIWLSNGNYLDRDLEPLMKQLEEIRKLIQDVKDDAKKEIIRVEKEVQDTRKEIRDTRKRDLFVVTIAIIIAIIIAAIPALYLYIRIFG